MSIVYATGFEMGTTPFLSSERVGSSGSVTSSLTYTGNYAYVFGNNTYISKLLPTTSTTASIACHFRPTTAGIFRIKFIFDDGGQVYLAHNSDKTISLYVQSSLIEKTVRTVEVGYWSHLEINLSASATVGTIVVKLNGHTLITYNGDTQPVSSNNISTWEIGNFGSGSNTIDNLVITNDTGLIGDMRFVALTPNSDTATLDWTPSTGGTNYNLVDEIPASDSDYVYTATNGNQDLYTFTDFDSSGLTPSLVVQWCRALAETADGQGVKLLLYSGTTLTTGTNNPLALDYRYFHEIYETDPDTSSAWTDSAIDALQAGQEAVV